MWNVFLSVFNSVLAYNNYLIWCFLTSCLFPYFTIRNRAMFLLLTISCTVYKYSEITVIEWHCLFQSRNEKLLYSALENIQTDDSPALPPSMWGPAHSWSCCQQWLRAGRGKLTTSGKQTVKDENTHGPLHSLQTILLTLVRLLS